MKKEKTPSIDPAILIAVKEELNGSTGMCYAAGTAFLKFVDIIGYKKNLAFKNYLEETLIKNRKRFYYGNGKRTTDNNQYVWPTYEHTQRHKWLDKHIALNTKDSSKS